MGKGEAWVNGQSIGRYWPAYLSPPTGCTENCDYRGKHDSSTCQRKCGQSTQTLYHLPRAWVHTGKNLLVLHEELGGDPSKITVLTRTGEEVICSSVSEDDPPPLDSWKLNNAKYFTSHQSQPELRLACSDERGLISSINFSSFGNPRGNCGSYVPGDCHADMSSFVRKACLGKKGCSIPLKRVSRELGNDHCPGLVKRVAVEAVCS